MSRRHAQNENGVPETNANDDALSNSSRQSLSQLGEGDLLATIVAEKESLQDRQDIGTVLGGDIGLDLLRAVRNAVAISLSLKCN